MTSLHQLDTASLRGARPPTCPHVPPRGLLLRIYKKA